jgi:hypothetical protein
LFETINRTLAAQGLMMREGTIADATIIAAPPSVKNEAKKLVIPRCTRPGRATSGTSA